MGPGAIITAEEVIEELTVDEQEEVVGCDKCPGHSDTGVESIEHAERFVKSALSTGRL